MERLPETPSIRFLDVHFSGRGFQSVVDEIVRRHPADPFAFVVTPNVDHVVRIHRQEREHLLIYDRAWLCTCDSRVLQFLARIMWLPMPLVSGSDLVAHLFHSVLKPGDTVSVIGCTREIIEVLRKKHAGLSIHHYVPPFGFIHDDKEVEKTVSFVETVPARFVFLAVGSPQQELLATRIEQRGRSRGLGLCVGNSLAFVAKPRLRAPIWLRRLGLEWAHRLMTEPTRLWRRYLVNDPYIFVLYARAWGARLPKRRSAGRFAAAKRTAAAAAFVAPPRTKAREQDQRTKS